MTVEIFEPCITIPALRKYPVVGLNYVQGSLKFALQTYEKKEHQKICSYQGLIKKECFTAATAKTVYIYIYIYFFLVRPKPSVYNTDLWKKKFSFISCWKAYNSRPNVKPAQENPEFSLSHRHFLQADFSCPSLCKWFSLPAKPIQLYSAWPTSLLSSKSSVCQIPIKLRAKQSHLPCSFKKIKELQPIPGDTWLIKHKTTHNHQSQLPHNLH